MGKRSGWSIARLFGECYGPLPPAGPSVSSKYITPEGATALTRELDDLWRTQRPAVTKAVAEAAAQGDRSENAEYIYGSDNWRRSIAAFAFCVSA